LQQDYKYGAESTQDNKNSNDNTSQEFQKGKITKRSKGKPRKLQT
jgi:hypothetical protein